MLGFTAPVVFGVLFHTKWLPLLATPLLAPSYEEQTQPDVVWLRSPDGHSLSPDEVLPRAAEILRRDPQAVVIFTQGWPSRLVELGVIPPMIERVRSALAEYDVSPDRVIEISPSQIGFWYEAQAFEAYLKEHPDARAVFFAEEFAGRSSSLVLRSAMSEETYRRVRITGVPRGEFSSHNWWRCRAGLKGLMVGYLYLVYTILEPRPLVAAQPLSLEDFEALIPDASQKVEDAAR